MRKDKIQRQKPVTVDPQIRSTNFEEVEKIFEPDQALLEAQRCLQCKKPKCVDGCPVAIDIPAFIKHIVDGDIEKAGNKIRESSLLPSVCGRVCPQERQCEQECILGIKSEAVAIGALERYVGDLTDQQETPITPTGFKVAIVGSGPSSITAAADLAKDGHQIVVFEALHSLGGVLRYGIPEFRLPRHTIEKEINNLKKLGVEFKTNIIIGKSLTIQDLFSDGFNAIFIGVGAGLPWFLGIPGENLNGVYSANEFLTRVNLMKANEYPKYPTPVLLGEKVVVIGGGNTAMDAARVAKRLGYKEVTVAYRRTEKEMPARKAEYEHAIEEGINFLFLHSPIEIAGKEGLVRSISLQVMQLGEPDSSGRRRPVAVEGNIVTIETDAVIIAIGTSPNPVLTRSIQSEDLPIEVNKDGYIIINPDTGETSMKGVFAGGDISPIKESNVINAMGAGKKAAAAITKYLNTL